MVQLIIIPVERKWGGIFLIHGFSLTRDLTNRYFARGQNTLKREEGAMRKASLTSLLFMAFAGAFIANQALAQTYNLKADLDSLQEVPPNETLGSGSADLTLNAAAGTITIDAGTGEYSNLLVGATSVRIQDAAPTANGPTLVSLTLDTPGNTSGTFSGGGTLTSGGIAAALIGNTYINITDPQFPSGEIRGQIVLVPEPGTLALLGGAGLLALRRPRKRSA
jgi:hypothetical protein